MRRRSRACSSSRSPPLDPLPAAAAPGAPDGGVGGLPRAMGSVPLAGRRWRGHHVPPASGKGPQVTSCGRLVLLARSYCLVTAAAGWLTLKTNPDCVLQSTRGTVCNGPCKSTPDLNHSGASLQSRLPPPPHTPKRQQPNSLTRAPTSFSPGLSPTREQHWPSLARRLPSPGFPSQPQQRWGRS